MNKSQILALFDQDQRKKVEFPDMRREVTPELVRHVDSSAGGEGLLTYSQLTETNADDAIRAQVRYFESLGQDFEWKLYDYDQPSDLKERLESGGFIIGAAEAVMLLDLQAAPGILWQPPRQQVQPITDAGQIADVLAIHQQVWEEDFSSLGEYLAGTLSRHPEQMSVYMAYVDGQPASAAWIYFQKHSQFASLWGGATIEGYRKRGLYTALLAVRAQEAKARRVRYLSVDASTMSRPILEKLGFEMIAYSCPCTWKRRS
jgi:predicted GNAT family acetyltransferase